MARRWRILGTILSVALVVGACAPDENGEPELAAGAEGLVVATPPELRHVLLKYAPADGNEDCKIEVYDERLTIWKSSKPNLIEWQVLDAANDDHQWVIEKKAGQGRFNSGKFVIPCQGHKAHRSGVPIQIGTWTYSVKVYDCQGGQPHGDPVCERDPDIMIWE